MIYITKYVSGIKTFARAFADLFRSKQPVDEKTKAVDVTDEKTKALDERIATESRNWRLTKYLIADQKDHGSNDVVPVLDQNGNLLKRVDPGFFSFMSLQGTGKMVTGELYNVTGKWIKVDGKQYASVKTYHDSHMSKRPYGYSGIIVNKSGDVGYALTWAKIEKDALGKGYGTQNGIPLDPFKTLAADLGRTKRSEPKFKGQGGLVPVGTKVFIEWFKGKKMPDGSIHDGWFVVNDTGGGIFGAHFDVFVGTKSLYKAVNVPSHSKIWFDGIAEAVDVNYSYGLHDE